MGPAALLKLFAVYQLTGHYWNIALILLAFMGSLKVFAQTPLSKTCWIKPAVETDTVNRPCPVFMKNFDAAKKIYRASLSITVHGLYEAVINGKRVGKAYFTPGWSPVTICAWTNWRKRMRRCAWFVSWWVSRTPVIFRVLSGSSLGTGRRRCRSKVKQQMKYRIPTVGGINRLWYNCYL